MSAHFEVIRRAFARSATNDGDLDKVDDFEIIGAFGTCGQSASQGDSWRAETFLPILEKYNLQDKVFNPEISSWTPERAYVESVHMARDRVLAVGITNKTESHASVLDAGFAVYGGYLRHQTVIVSLEYDENTPEASRRGRILAKTILSSLEETCPIFTIADDISELGHRSAIALSDALRFNEGKVHERTELILPPLRKDLAPSVYLSGTSGTQKPQWMKEVTDRLMPYDIPVDDSYRSSWDLESAADELQYKTDIAVQLIAVTDATEGLGTLAELAPRVMQADMTGQSVGVYIEPHNSPATSAANRTRLLAREHFARLREDFSNIPVFLADNLEQLSLFGLCEYYKQRQRLHAGPDERGEW
jgi:hypothetical protein